MLLKNLNLTKREKFLLALFFAILIVLGLGKFFFLPQFNQINKLKTELATKNKIYQQKIDQGLSDVSLLKERARGFKSDISEINQQVPDVINEPQILVDIYNKAKVNNLQANIIQFSDSNTAESKKYSYITVKLKLQGTDKNIYQFVQDMESYDRLNSIVAADFIPEDNVKATCTLKIAFYTLPTIKEDPLSYTFTKDNKEKKKPYEIFNKEKDKEEIVDYNTDSVQVNPEIVPAPDPNSTEKSSEQKANTQLINP